MANILQAIRLNAESILRETAQGHKKYRFYADTNSGWTVELISSYCGGDLVVIDEKNHEIPAIRVFTKPGMSVREFVLAAEHDFALSVDFLVEELGGEEALHRHREEERKRWTA